MAAVTLALTGDAPADRLLAEDPLALLIGMLLDQQFPMERAFHSPYELKERLDGRLDVVELAEADPDALAATFAGPPALHRYPASMAARTQQLCRHLIESFGGRADAVWTEAASGGEVLVNLRSLPGFGDQKSRIFVALLAKRLGVRPPGWEEAAGTYAAPGYFSVADVDSPDALARVREHKKAAKAQARAVREARAARAASETLSP